MHGDSGIPIASDDQAGLHKTAKPLSSNYHRGFEMRIAVLGAALTLTNPVFLPAPSA